MPALYNARGSGVDTRGRRIGGGSSLSPRQAASESSGDCRVLPRWTLAAEVGRECVCVKRAVCL